MPAPGAVWPAIVTSPYWIVKMLLPSVSSNGSLAFGSPRSITPLTSNTMIRAPWVASASFRLPAPDSASVVTFMTLPPRPPLAAAPNPCAPGKAGSA
jgi:hypothetical protein